jgi:hypothetical protein
MANQDYFRKQAELCVQLADMADGEERALRFKLLALNFLLKAAGIKSNLDQIRERGAGPRFSDGGPLD